MHPPSLPPVTVIRPVCGLDDVERETLGSTFRLPTSTEIIFCVARETDAAIPYLRTLVAQHPGFNVRVFVGSDGPDINPKLDNVRKGWRAASNDWVAIADSNVLMDDTYVWSLLSAWRDDVGAVCAPPFAISGSGLWAEVEKQILNGHQARWQYAADAVGLGFAQGKSLLFRKSLMDGWGGMAALDIDVAEDAATTKVVRRNGLRVRLASKTILQPLGARTLHQVWGRQCRWEQLRRQSFPALYALGPLAMLLPVLVLTALGAPRLGWPLVAAASVMTAAWLSAEAAMSCAAGWRLSARSLFGAVLRELMLPLVWLAGLRLRPFTWRQPAGIAPEPLSI